MKQTIEEALPVFEQGGATLIEIEDAIKTDYLEQEVSVHFEDLKTDLNAYLSQLRADAPVHSIEDILESGKYHPSIEGGLRKALQVFVGTPTYNRKLIRQGKVKTRIMKIMADGKLDAIVYPHQLQLVCKIGEKQQQRNGVLCSVTGFPSITVPAGFAPANTAPIGVPLGLEIAGRPFSEAVLIEIAYAFEQLSQFRKAPTSTPSLTNRSRY